MVSANTLNKVLQFLETDTESIHPCRVRTRVTKPVADRVMQLHWDVESNLLFPGDQEIHLHVEGVDDDYDWRFDRQTGYCIRELEVAVQMAWERCEAELLIEA